MNQTATTGIVRNKDGRIVRRIEGKTFVKEAHGRLHMLRYPIAWAIDADIFDRVIAPLCYSIHIIDRDTGHKYVCGVDTFRDNSHKINRKFGDQYYLELVHWKIERE